jgi:hypothetical protein
MVVLNNRDDAEFIKTEAGQQQMALAIADGIARCVPAPKRGEDDNIFDKRRPRCRQRIKPWCITGLKKSGTKAGQRLSRRCMLLAVSPMD